MHTGHDDRTRAVLEHARRRSETRVETRVQKEVPDELKHLLLEMGEQIRLLKAEISVERARVDAILNAVEAVNG